jgi:hypothetical protein
MKTILLISAVLTGLLFITCNNPVEPEKIIGTSHLSKVQAKATGTVEVLRLTNNGNGDPNDKIMIADFNAHEEHDGQNDHGEFIFSVLKTDSTVHRIITVDLDWVYVDVYSNKSWFKGTVISDTKGCSGNGSGGHDESCEGSGCSGDVNGDHTEGCTGHDSGHDSGCSGDDGETHEDGCEGSGGQGGNGGNGGSGANGKNCRLGQILVVKVHDVGTPGTNGDGITWKWFDPDDERVTGNGLENTLPENWPHLCKKTIIGGNLVVHFE